MPPLDPGLVVSIIVSVVTGIVTVSGVVYTMRANVGKLETGQVEMLRQLGALHKRLDHHGERITKTERDQAVLNAVLQERTSMAGPRDSQRFRLARGEAAAAGQPPMFEGDE